MRFEAPDTSEVMALVGFVLSAGVILANVCANRWRHEWCTEVISQCRFTDIGRG